MTLHAIDAWWWPFLFILAGGWAATYPFRFLGVYLGDRISDESDILVLVRAIATALVAGVIGNFICFPTGAAADSTLALRIAAAGIGFAAYFFLGRGVLTGIVASEIIFVTGLYAGF